MENELTVEELQAMYGGMDFYDKVERRSLYIPKSGELTEYQIHFLRRHHEAMPEVKGMFLCNISI